MNLVYYPLNVEIELFSDKLNAIVIEHPIELEKFVMATSKRLEKQSEEVEIFQELKKLELKKEAELILSPMDFTYTKKEVQKKLLETLIQEIHHSQLMENFTENCSDFFNNLENLKLSSFYHLDFNEDFGVDSLLKSFDVRLSDPAGTFCEKLIDYTKNIHALLGKTVFILISCSQYIAKDDFPYLLQHCQYEKIRLLFVEPRQMNLNFPINERIIDLDLCEIY